MKLPAGGLLFLTCAAGVLSAEKDGLEESDRQQLQLDKVMVGKREFRQCFEPYINNNLPVFITSDALLNAFHVIFEESFARMESTGAAKLEALLQRLVKSLPAAMKEFNGAADLKAKAARRAEIMLKTALRLLGRPSAGSTAEIERVIAAQVKEVEAASGRRKPDWLGPPDDGFMALDFTRYAPRGLYSRSLRMQRYFRAVAWLQSVPFRVNRDEEFVAIAVLGRAYRLSLPESGTQSIAQDSFFDSWGALLPGREDFDLRDLGYACGRPEWIDMSGEGGVAVRQNAALTQFTEQNPHINDLLRRPPFMSHGARDPHYRILAAAVLPDAVMFQQTSLPDSFPQRFPDTLEVAAGMGSEWALGRLNSNLQEADWKKVRPAVMWLAEREPGASLYDEYLTCLRELVNTTDAAAPDFMRSEPWKRKSCQTVLASWAQMRHTLLLQAKINQMYLAGSGVPPGFVEPDPEFFRRLGELTLRCLACFSGSGMTDDNSEFVIVEELQAGRDAADALCKSGGAWRDAADFTAINRAGWRAGTAAPHPKAPDFPERGKDTTAADFEKKENEYRKALAEWAARFRDALETVLKKLESADAASRAPVLQDLGVVEAPGLAVRWQGLARMCSQAQSIAHYQLRKMELTGEQKEFIKGFGKLLAQAMFYDGNSYLQPRDDAPVVADVFGGGKEHLHAATGRPRILYVLYPQGDSEVLCVGAVLPYYEFKHGPDRMTDVAWRERLKTNAPPLPSWVQPLFAPGDVEAK